MNRRKWAWVRVTINTTIKLGMTYLLNNCIAPTSHAASLPNPVTKNISITDSSAYKNNKNNENINKKYHEDYFIDYSIGQNSQHTMPLQENSNPLVKLSLGKYSKEVTSSFEGITPPSPYHSTNL